MDNHPYLAGYHEHNHDQTSDHDHLLAEFESPFTLTAPPAAASSSTPSPDNEANERESPFYATPAAVEETTGDPRAELFAQFLDEFHDDEFDAAVVDLSNELERFAHEHQLDQLEESETAGPRQQELLEQHLRPLIVATDRYLADLAQEMARHDQEALAPEQMDELFERFAARHELGNPVFEHFFKRLRRKFRKVAKRVRSAVKKGVRMVKRLSPVHLIMRKLRGLAGKLFHRIIRRVINRLPSRLRGPAARLAKRLGLGGGRRRSRRGKVRRELYEDELYEDELYEDELYEDEIYEDEIYEDEFYEDEVPALVNTAALPAAAPEPELIQREFDLLLTGQLLADNETEADRILELYVDEAAERRADENAARLSKARERLVTALSTAKTAEEVQPQVEEFIGVALKAIKIGVRLIGRDRVVKFIAGIFTKLIARLIGPQAAAPLAHAIVDKGFRLLNLEVPGEEAESRLAGETIAQVLEELSLHVATLEAETLDDKELLEQEIVGQFSQLVATNFPTTMVQEELRESETAAAWALLPQRGRKRYKKYGHVPQVTLSYGRVRGLLSFGGQYLYDFLRRRHGYRRGQQLRARVHIFEAVPGTTLSHISLLERGTRGLGSARRGAWSQIHPLTPRVAGQLLGNPALGRRVSSRWLRSRHRIQVRQRFFYLEVLDGGGGSPGGGGDYGGGGGGRQPDRKGPPNSVHPPVRRDEALVKLDFTRSTVTLALLMTEDKAAEMTRRLRANDYFGAAATFRTSIREALNNVLLRHAGRQVKIVMEAEEERYLEGFLGGLWRKAKKAVGGVLVGQVEKLVAQLLKKLVAQAEKALANHLRRLRADFIRAQEDGARGVSIHLVFLNVPGMGLLGAILRHRQGKPLRVGDVARAVLPAVPMPDVRLFPGRKAL